MINVEEFRDLIREVVRDELGDRTRYKIAEIASVGDKVSVIFSGEPEPTQKEYTYLKSYYPVVGDRVWLAKDKGTYVVLGKIDQYDEPMSGENENGHWTKFPDGTMFCWHDMNLGDITTNGSGTFSDPYRSPANVNNWTFPKPFIDPPKVYAQLAIDNTNWGMRSGTVHFRSPTSDEVTLIQAIRANGSSEGVDAITSLMAIGKWK